MPCIALPIDSSLVNSPPEASLNQGHKRPHKHSSLKCWLYGPKQRGFGRILIFTWSFEPRKISFELQSILWIVGHITGGHGILSREYIQHTLKVQISDPCLLGLQDKIDRSSCGSRYQCSKVASWLQLLTADSSHCLALWIGNLK